MEELAYNPGFVQTLQFLRRVVFLLFCSVFCFTVQREYHCTKSAMMQIILPRVVIWHEFDVWRNEFANLSLPCEGRFR